MVFYKLRFNSRVADMWNSNLKKKIGAQVQVENKINLQTRVKNIGHENNKYNMAGGIRWLHFNNFVFSKKRIFVFYLIHLIHEWASHWDCWNYQKLTNMSEVSTRKFLFLRKANYIFFIFFNFESNQNFSFL